MNRKSLTIILLLLFAFSNYIYAQTIYYVDSAKSNNSGNGLSWATAKKNIQDAITLATSGSEIWVKAGTYFPDEGTGLTNNDRTSAFTLKTDVKIFGSFVGTETLITQRVIDLNNLTTILSGEIQQDTDTTNNSYHVVTAIDLSGATWMDGLKVKLGYANGGGFNERNGGGMLVDAQLQATNALRVSFCVFEWNYAANQGGGMYMEAITGKTFTNYFEDVQFLNNRAGFDGGGVCASGRGGSNLSQFGYSLFRGNKANSGGGMHISASQVGIASVGLLFISFEDNFATTDAGALSNRVPNGISNTVVLFCTFINNYAGGSGGAVYSVAAQGANNLQMINSNFFLNKTAPTFSGGAVYVLSSNAIASNNTKINKCTFSENESGFGGAVSYAANNGTITSYVYQSLFIKNKGTSISAVYSYMLNGTANVNLVNCTVTENISIGGAAVETFKTGTGISNFKAVNTIVWNNTNFTAGKDVKLRYADDQIINSIVSNANCSETGPGSCSNTLYAVNPLFVNPVGNNYALQSCSPAINRGISNGTTIGMDSTDLANNPRYIDTIDIGAYEYVSSIVITWLGITNNWGTASNWNTGLVPTICNDVIVNSGTLFQPVVNGTYFCRKLTVNTGASVNVQTGTLYIVGY